jgi:hypothetical protein
MALSHSPKIVTDSLVFMYDTDDGKSYKGEPTVNLATDSPSQGGWAGGREVLDSSRKKFRFIVDNFNGSAGSGQGWRSFTWDLNSYSGQSVTISATVEVPSASPGTFAWIMMGQTNTHTSNNSGAGQYMGYSASSERVQKTTTTTEHITWTGTVGSTGTASQPSGHVGFTLWYNGGTIGVDSYVEVSNVQIEINSHATQFVNGTRSDTQGLIDRTSTSTINISNASFDSNAQMTFDGTDDYLAVPHNSSQSFTGDFSIEAVIKGESNTANCIIQKGSGNDYYQEYWLLQDMRSSQGKFSLIMGKSGNSSANYLNTSNVLSQNIYYHVVATVSGSTSKIFINGVEAESGSISNRIQSTSDLRIGWRVDGFAATNGEIPIVKLYNKALTAAEVLQNYNATKGRFS